MVSAHQPGQTNDDVGAIDLPNLTMFLTRGRIGQRFRNLKTVTIFDLHPASLKHNFSSGTFENMENLIELTVRFRGNENVEIGFLSNLPN